MPSPIPTLLQPEKDLNCPPQISNEVDRLMRELERLQASIPGAPPLAGGAQGFSVKNVFINIAQRLFQLNVGLPSAQQATQIAIGAATGAVAVALANELALRNEKAEIDRQFAEAVKNKNQSEKERLRNESNTLNRLLQTASDLVRKAEQAKARILQTSQKLAELSVKVDVLNRQTDRDCKEPTPSPSPTLIFPPTPSSTPTARPTPPGCFRDCSPDSDFPDSIEVIDKTGNIAISYSNEQCKEFEHNVELYPSSGASPYSKTGPFIERFNNQNFNLESIEDLNSAHITDCYLDDPTCPNLKHFQVKSRQKTVRSKQQNYHLLIMKAFDPNQGALPADAEIEHEDDEDESIDENRNWHAPPRHKIRILAGMYMPSPSKRLPSAIVWYNSRPPSLLIQRSIFPNKPSNLSNHSRLVPQSAYQSQSTTSASGLQPHLL